MNEHDKRDFEIKELCRLLRCEQSESYTNAFNAIETLCSDLLQLAARAHALDTSGSGNQQTKAKMAENNILNARLALREVLDLKVNGEMKRLQEIWSKYTPAEKKAARSRSVDDDG